MGQQDPAASPYPNMPPPAGYPYPPAAGATVAAPGGFPVAAASGPPVAGGAGPSSGAAAPAAAAFPPDPVKPGAHHYQQPPAPAGYPGTGPAAAGGYVAPYPPAAPGAAAPPPATGYPVAPMGVAGPPAAGVAPGSEKCACSLGWVLFGCGWIIPLCWIVGCFLPFCSKNRNDRRAAMGSGIMLLLYIVLIVALSVSSPSWSSGTKYYRD